MARPTEPQRRRVRTASDPVHVDPEWVRRVWFDRQGLTRPRRHGLTRRRFVTHLSRTGALQLDSVNVVDRAHYLTLWSRFGAYDRRRVDGWAYRDRVCYEYWGHEASLLPAAHLPISRRAMRRFDPGDWWRANAPSRATFRRIKRRIREEGPLESADFTSASTGGGSWWGWKEEKRGLEWLWRRGELAVSARRHFRRLYDLSERVYASREVASLTDYEDSWLMVGLSGNGVASERHLRNYFTSPTLKADRRRRVLARALKRGTVREVRVTGFHAPFYATPETLAARRPPRPEGLTLVCPFDSLLWQRDRAEELLDFRYRVEIYVPPAKRVFGYYVLPILYDGRLVGRVDPKLERDTGTLVIRNAMTEAGFVRDARFDRAFGECVSDLAAFLGASRLRLPAPWRGIPH